MLPIRGIEVAEDGRNWPTREDSYLEACVSAAGGAADASETGGDVIDTSDRDPMYGAAVRCGWNIWRLSTADGLATRCHAHRSLGSCAPRSGLSRSDFVRWPIAPGDILAVRRRFQSIADMGRFSSRNDLQPAGPPLPRPSDEAGEAF
jgi:hypothetical protein